MSFSVRWLALAFLILVVVTALAAAPARVLNHFLPASSIVLQGVSGTVWRGQAAGCLIRMPGGFLQLGQTHWAVNPLSLLLFAPRVSVDSQWGEQRLRADLTYRGVDHLDVSDVEARINARLLQALLPVSLDGTLVLNMESAEIQQGVPLSVVGRLVWEDATWLSPQGAINLGSYAVDSRQVDRELQVTILTITGPLQADGLIKLSHKDEIASYELSLELGSEGVMNPQLQEALSLMASPTDSGYRLVLQGELQSAR